MAHPNETAKRSYGSREDRAKRNEQIWIDHAAGMTDAKIGLKHGLTRSRIGQIIAREFRIRRWGALEALKVFEARREH